MASAHTLAGFGRRSHPPQTALYDCDPVERQYGAAHSQAKNAGLPWDCILSAKLFGHYKPDPETYRGAARLLDVAIEQMMMVAAHPHDLRAARALGCPTAFVQRPLEFGAGRPLPEFADGEFDIVASDFIDLARQLQGKNS